MVECDLGWLKEKGFFKRTSEFVSESGKLVHVDEKNRLAYLEVENNEEAERLRREMQRIRYIWFYFPDKGSVKAFRRIGEVKWFCYTPRVTRTDYLKSKMDKLSKFSPDNITILFDIRDVVSRFYDQLWRMRLKMAQSIGQLKNDKNKLLVVQRFIDRLIFFYFLAQLGLVKIKNKEIDWVLDRKKTRKFFGWICDRLADLSLLEFLNKTFFDVLRIVEASGWSKNNFEINGEKFSVVGPSLNGGLFFEGKFEGSLERKIKIKHIKELIQDVLNDYNWIIGEELPEEEDVIGDLTPEILGHIYEKFIISLEQIGIDKIRLGDVQTIKGEIRSGRRKIGAYYTPEEVTNYISMNTIYPYLTDKINEKLRTSYRNIWNELINKPNPTKEEIERIKFIYFEILTKLKICDNACGSGSFLLAAGDILLRLYSRTIKILEENLKDDEAVRALTGEISKSPNRNYYIVRQIITNNLYGVDIMEGAVEIAKLRFWLWLISKARRGREITRIEPLPNLDFNLVIGNTLIGFVEPEEIEIDEEAFLLTPIRPRGQSKLMSEKMKQLRFIEGKPVIKIMKEIGELKKRFKLEYDFLKREKLKMKIEEKSKPLREELNKKLLEKFRSQGINISAQKLSELKPFHWSFEFYEVFDLNKLKEERGFDIIIGNPPYVENKKMEDKLEKTIFKANYSSAYKLFDSSVVFIERSYQILRKNGFFSYIATNKFISTDYGIKIRDLILERTELRELLDVSYIEIFRGIAIYPIIVIFKNAMSKARTVIGIKIADEAKLTSKSFDKFTIPQTKFLEIPNHILDISGNVLTCEKIRENKSVLPLRKVGKLYYRMLGFTNWTDILKFVSYEKPRGEYLKFIGTANVTSFVVDQTIPLKVAGKSFKNCYLKFYPSFSRDAWRIFEKEKLLIKEVAKSLTAAYDMGEYANLTGAYMLIIRSKDISPFYVLGLLNSKILDFYFGSLYGTTHMAGGYLRFNGSYLKELPIYIPKTSNEHRIIETLAKYIFAAKAASLEKKIIENNLQVELKKILDFCIYECYFKEELKTSLLPLVEPYLKDISALKSYGEKLKIVREVIEKIRNDEKIVLQINKIKSHPEIRIIENKIQQQI